MKKIEREELFDHVRGFLKAKGISLDKGSYAEHIQQGCHLLTDAINATQSTVERARAEVDRKLDQLRQSIHEATAPRPPAAGPQPEPGRASSSAKSKGKKGRRASPRRKAKGSNASPGPAPAS